MRNKLNSSLLGGGDFPQLVISTGSFAAVEDDVSSVTSGSSVDIKAFSSFVFDEGITFSLGWNQSEDFFLFSFTQSHPASAVIDNGQFLVGSWGQFESVFGFVVHHEFLVFNTSLMELPNPVSFLEFALFNIHNFARVFVLDKNFSGSWELLGFDASSGTVEFGVSRFGGPSGT